jgi:hypothetical protein|tara:strand:+ start:372 stop:539 length:168 start_codon:yes stop_codon:yes gene_type:complete
MKYKKVIDRLLFDYTDEELVEIEKELHLAIETELSDSILTDDEVMHYQRLGYDID